MHVTCRRCCLHCRRRCHGACKHACAGLQDAEALLQKHWERGPAVFRATPARVQLFEGLFSYAELLRLAAIAGEEGEALEFGVDVNAARYVDGRRETPNGEVSG